MIVEVNRNRVESIDEFFHQVDLDIQSALHEFEYNCMVDQYNYLVEYGVVMEASDEKNSIGKWLKNLANKFIEQIKKIGRWIKEKFNKLISKIKDPKKKKKIQDAMKDSAENAASAIRDIGEIVKTGVNGTIDSAKYSMSKIFDKFKSDEQRRLEHQAAIDSLKQQGFDVFEPTWFEPTWFEPERFDPNQTISQNIKPTSTIRQTIDNALRRHK